MTVLARQRFSQKKAQTCLRLTIVKSPICSCRTVWESDSPEVLATLLDATPESAYRVSAALGLPEQLEGCRTLALPEKRNTSESPSCSRLYFLSSRFLDRPCGKSARQV